MVIKKVFDISSCLRELEPRLPRQVVVETTVYTSFKVISGALLFIFRQFKDVSTFMAYIFYSKSFKHVRHVDSVIER